MIEHSSGRFAFREELQTLHFAAVLDAVRAKAALHAGDVKSAVALARDSERLEPPESDEFFDLVNAFGRSGHPVEGDAMRSEATGRFEELLKEFPQSALLENDLAWLMAHTGANLDQTLAHASRAAQLDPQSAAIADTLAEVYFRRGELQKAVDAMKKCIALAPNLAMEQKKLEEYQAALARQPH